MTLNDPFRRKVQPAQRSLGWSITANKLRLMWEHQRGMCAITGRRMEIASATIDHIVPRARGGSNELDNLRWATKAGNRAKGDLLDEEFIALCAEVTGYLGRSNP